MKKPSFFVAGAPKSGTTSLYYYLKEHPDLYLPGDKEPHYFATDLPCMRTAKTLTEYHALFEEASVDQLAGEASTNYIYSHDATKNIHDYDPEARLIFVIRNPVDVVQSLHDHLLYNDNEDIGTLRDAWEAVGDRRQGRRIPPGCETPHLLDYKRAGGFSPHLKRYTERFDSDRIRFILFDDFKTDTETVYRRTLDFLGVPYRGRTDFPTYNPRRRHRWSWLGSFTEREKFPFLEAWRRIKDFLGLDVSLIGTLRTLNTRRKNRNDRTDPFRETLEDYFEDEILRLERFLERDLSGWFTRG